MSSADDLAFIKSWVNTRAEEFNSIKPPKPPRKPRRRTNKTQQSLLESAFQDNRRPNTAAKELLARKLGMDVRTVQIWFQNRRQTLRKKKLEPIIVPQNSENSDEKQCKGKREYTVLKLDYKIPKRSQTLWHDESSAFNEKSESTEYQLPQPMTSTEAESNKIDTTYPAGANRDIKAMFPRPSRIDLFPSIAFHKISPSHQPKTPQSPVECHFHYPRSLSPEATKNREESVEGNSLKLPPLHTLPFLTQSTSPYGNYEKELGMVYLPSFVTDSQIDPLHKRLIRPSDYFS